MRVCLRCGKSLEGKGPEAKYCCFACRLAGYVSRQVGKMWGSGGSGLHPGGSRNPKQSDPPGNASQAKETIYVYAMGWGPNLGCEGIKRYEIREGHNRLFVQPYSYDFIPLPADWNPEAFRWRFVGIPHDPIRKTIERKSGYWFVEDAVPEKFYSLEQIENQWRKRPGPESEKESQRDTRDDGFRSLDRLAEPESKARQLLGVSAEASAAEIKLAYLALSNQYHPDRGGDGIQMREINAAYQLLVK